MAMAVGGAPMAMVRSPTSPAASRGAWLPPAQPAPCGPRNDSIPICVFIRLCILLFFSMYYIMVICDYDVTLVR